MIETNHLTVLKVVALTESKVACPVDVVDSVATSNPPTSSI